MQRYDADTDFDCEGIMRPSADGDYVLHHEAMTYAAEQVKKARLEVLEEAQTALASMWADSEFKPERVTISACVSRLHKLMEEEG